jgi:hypothetical protein
MVMGGLPQPVELIGFEVGPVSKISGSASGSGRVTPPELRLMVPSGQLDSVLLGIMHQGSRPKEVRVQTFGGAGPNGLHSEWIVEDVSFNFYHVAAGLPELKPQQAHLNLPMPRSQWGLVGARVSFRVYGSNSTVLSQFCWDFVKNLAC